MIAKRWIILWLISIGTVSGQPRFLPERVSLQTNQGFCRGGAYPASHWVEGKAEGLNTWGSYCANGDQDTGSAATTPFIAPAHLRLYLSGYTSLPGIILQIQRLSGGSKLVIRPIEQPAARWLSYEFELPRSWLGKPVRLIAEDRSTNPGGWLAFSEPLDAGGPRFGLDEASAILWRTLSHFLLTILPAFAICAIFVHRGLRCASIAGLVVLATTGLVAYTGFWFWFIWPPLGHLIAFLLPILSAACLVLILPRLNHAQKDILRTLLTPVLLTGAAALLILSTGFLYGGMREPNNTAETRFSHTLPPDNAAPYVFAENIRVGVVPKMLIGDWLSSDRPPLQAGIALSQYPCNPKPRILGYTILSAIAQSFWIFALWILLNAFGLDRRAIVLVFLVCLFSGFVFVNTFFVWPKLLAASYTLGLFPLLLSDGLRNILSKNRLVAALAGALLAFGLLSHGGSAFAVIGIALTMLARISHE